MRADRLLKLADFLETVPVSAFDLGEWTSHDADKPEGEKPGDCGYAGCAVGWAAHAKLFEGFSLGEYGEPVFNEFDNWTAVRHLFDIQRTDAAHLFSSFAYEKHNENPSPDVVAKRIREFVTKATAS